LQKGEEEGGNGKQERGGRRKEEGSKVGVPKIMYFFVKSFNYRKQSGYRFLFVCKLRKAVLKRIAKKY
jgi:hypothetical protein